MNIIAYGDSHIHPFAEFSKVLDSGITNRVQIAIDSMRWILDKAVESKVDAIIHLGDLFETPKSINTQVASLLCELLDSPKYRNLVHYFIMGNHDIMDYSHKYNVAKLFTKFFKIIDAINYQEMYKTTGIVFLPYLHNTQEALTFLDAIPKEDKKKTYCFGHWSVDGVKYTEDYPVKTNAKRDYFKDFKYSIFGHIHLRQVLDTNIIYPGSLLTHSFKSNTGGKGGIHIVGDTYKFLDNPHSPVLNRVEINSKEDLDKVEITEYTRVKIKPNLMPELELKLNSLDFKPAVSLLQDEDTKILKNSNVDYESEDSVLMSYVKSKNLKKSTYRYSKLILNGVGQ